MRRTAPWILIIVISAVADWSVRILTDFDMPRVFAAEALIFPISALALGVLRWRSPASGRKTRALQTVLVWTFVLAGLRAAIVAFGSSYLSANIVPFCLAVLGIGVWWRRRRTRQQDGETDGGTIVSLCVVLMCFTGCSTESPESAHESDSTRPPVEQSAARASIGFQDRIPADLLVADSACPFECCTYREWKAPVPLPRLDAPIDGSPIDTIAQDESFEALTGTVFVTGIQLVVVGDSLNGFGEARPPVADSRAPWTAQFLPGDTLLTLDYVGEGFYRVWDGADAHEVQQFWWPADHEDAAPDWARHGRATGTYGSVWWIRSRRTGGVEGWFRAPDSYIPGSDACGVD
jgi:hypothetical protein